MFLVWSCIKVTRYSVYKLGPPTNTPKINQSDAKTLKTTKKLESKTNLSTKISIEENYNDSTKNLANFFNGEIIDLDE